MNPGSSLDILFFKGLKPLVLHERDWEGEPGSQGSQKTCQEEPLRFSGLRMEAVAEKNFQLAIV